MAVRHIFSPVLVLTCLAFCTAQAQTVQRRPFIRASGEASVSIKPDQAKLTISVTTQGRTADEASQANATKATAVFERLRQVIGTNGEIETVSFTVSPQYTYPREGGTPTLIGFVATNSVDVTVRDLNLTSRVIDSAIEAGATRVDTLRLGLRDEDPARAQALRQAAQKARVRVEAIALGLGVRLGSLVSAEEGRIASVIPANRLEAAALSATPIEAGTLQIHATVTVEYETAQ